MGLITPPVIDRMARTSYSAQVACAAPAQQRQYLGFEPTILTAGSPVGFHKRNTQVILE